MSKSTARSLSSILLTVAILEAATSAQAGPPGGSAYAEQATMFGTGKVIHVYRLPTVDVNGNVQFFDLQFTLPISETGVPGNNAKIVAVVSPTFVGNNFVAGNYTTPDYNTTTCIVGVSTMQDGRESGAMNCNGGNGYFGSFAWATGPIDGSPYEQTLLAAGIDKIEGYQDFGWGVAGSSTPSPFFGCFYAGDVISATQAGKIISITDYGHSNVAKCEQAFTLQN